VVGPATTQECCGWANHDKSLGGAGRVLTTCRRAGPLDFGYLAQIAAVSPRTVFLVGGRSSLLVTTDGGSHWRTVRPPLGDTSGGTSQVIFVNRRDGFALGDDFRNGEAPTIWRTTDGGRRWSGVVPRP